MDQLSHYFLHTPPKLWSVKHLNHLFLPGLPEIHHRNQTRMGDYMGGLPRPKVPSSTSVSMYHHSVTDQLKTYYTAILPLQAWNHNPPQLTFQPQCTTPFSVFTDQFQFSEHFQQSLPCGCAKQFSSHILHPFHEPIAQGSIYPKWSKNQPPLA